MIYHYFLNNFPAAFIENLIWYVGFSFPAFLIFWLIWKKHFAHLRIQQTVRATLHHFKHDLGFSVSTFFIFALIDVSLFYLEENGHTFLYYNIEEYGWPWLLLSGFIVLFLDDTFFYWSHRAMHHPKLYKIFHKVHHESTDPSPFTAFAFHPSEAFVEQSIHFILPFLLPLNFGVLIFWQVFSMLNNVLGHLGYEIYPKNWMKFPILQYKTVSTHHNMHHQLFNGNYALYFTWWDKWMSTEFPDFKTNHQQIFERKKVQKNINGFYPLKISEIKIEPNNAFTLIFEEIPQLFKQFYPGQHITLKININGEILYRTFSLSSIPNKDKFISLTIKKILGGKVTNYLYKHLKIGDIVEASAPSGQFYIVTEPANKNHYVMIAGGTGITPIYSMIGSILYLEPFSKITLLYANKNEDSIIYKDIFSAWQQEFPSQLNVLHFLSEQENPRIGMNGFISRISLENILNEKETLPRIFYLCGPELMTNKLIADLEYLGVNRNKIYRELFLISGINSITTHSTATVSANVFGEKYEFNTVQNQTILQSALSQNIPLPYSCQSGLCGTCKMKCTDGKVEMRNNQVLNAEELKSGYILTCQALPKSKKIIINN